MTDHTDYIALLKAQIKLGDTVTAIFIEGNDECEGEAIVVGTPSGAGDLWQIQWADSGHILAFNPYRSTFVGMVKKAHKEIDESKQ